MENVALKKYKVYYFTGDFWSSKGEKRQRNYHDRNFGWVEEYVKEK